MKLEAAFLDKVSSRAEVLWTSGDDHFSDVRDKGAPGLMVRLLILRYSA